MDLTLLDIGIYKSQGKSIDKINHLFEIIPVIEELGYKRLWLGEHHDHDCAWRSPEILISLLLASSDKIKIGSAGNLLRLHNPLRLVHDYSLMESMFPGRVDMGIAAGTTTEINMKALLKHNNQDSFSEKVNDLFGFFETSFNKDNEFHTIQTPPYIKGLKPDMWFLSTSNSKFELAINNEANYAWSLFHTPKSTWPNGDSVLIFEELYYKANNKLPETALAISGICLEDKSRAESIKKLFKDNLHPTIVGSKEECSDQINNLLQKYKGVKELVICDLSLEIEEKKESCKLFKEIVNDI